MLLKRLNIISWLQKDNYDSNVPSGGLVSKIQYDPDKQNLEKGIEGVDQKIPNSNNLVR